MAKKEEPRLRGVAVGELARPRVALVGLSEEEQNGCFAFFNSGVITAQGYDDLRKQAHAKELDLVISAIEYGGEDPESPYAACHLMLFGPQAWHSNYTAPGPEYGKEDHYYSCQLESLSSMYHLAADMAPMLRAVVERSLPSSVMGYPIISHRAYAYGDEHDRPDPARPKGWLAWAEEPELPLAVNVWRKPINKGLAWFPYEMPNRFELIRAVCYEWAKLDPDTFPTIVPWTQLPDWMTAGELAIRQKYQDEEATMVRMIQGYQTSLRRIESEFLQARDRADNGPRALLTSQDETLVNAVQAVFEEMGFKVKNVDEERKREGKPLVDDLRLTLDDDPTFLALVEIKGYSKRGAPQGDLGQLNQHVVTFLIENPGTLPSHKWYVCNTQYATRTPDMRDRPYANGAADRILCNDPHVRGLVIPSLDLFRLHRDLGTVGKEQARELLMTGTSVFEYPLPDEDEGSDE